MKCLIESLLTKNEMKMTVKILLIDSHILLKWRVMIKCYGGEQVQEVQYDPPLQLSTKSIFLLTIFIYSFTPWNLTLLGNLGIMEFLSSVNLLIYHELLVFFSQKMAPVHLGK